MLEESADPVYALVPAKPLPVIDLSKSVRGKLLSTSAHTSIHRFLDKYHRPLLLANMTAMILNVVVTGVDAQTGQILAVISLALWLPMGLGAPSTLRYDIVRLVMRTFDFWFFSCATTITAIMLSIYFWDLRFCRMMIDWIGFHNIVFIDGQVRGIRPFVCVTALGIPPLLYMLLWVMLDRLDGCTGFSLLSHRNEHTHFKLSVVDIIGNGMVTLSLLITKLVVRKRQSLNSERMSSIIECVIYRCGLKLEQVDRLAIVRAQQPRSINAAIRKNAVGPTESSTFCEPNLIQQMQFIKFPQTFNSNHVFLPRSVAASAVAVLYAIGASGFLLSFSIFVSNTSGTDLVTLSTQAWGALLCTLIFMIPFAALYQRDLFKLLVTSFDFLFYTFQTTTATLSGCILYNWERSRCLMLFTWWVWIHWALTLDALTPVMREKLRFRLRMAAPVVALVLVGHIAVISRIFFVGDEKLCDAVLYHGVIWGHELVVRAIPFYFSRVATIALWFPRLIWRLSTASNSEVTIIRGGVCFENYFAKHGRQRSRGINTTKRMQIKRQKWLFRRAGVRPTEEAEWKAQTTPKPAVLVAIQPQPE